MREASEQASKRQRSSWLDIGPAIRILVLALPLLITGCASSPDWADPTEWFDDETPEPSAQVDEDAEIPSLAEVPDEPRAASPEELRAQTAQGLAADRANAQYSDESLTAEVGVSEAPPVPAAPSASAAAASPEPPPEAPQAAPVPEVQAAPQTPQVASAAQATQVAAAPQLPQVEATPQTPQVAAAPQTAQVAAAPQLPQVAATPQTPQVAATPQAPPATVAPATTEAPALSEAATSFTPAPPPRQSVRAAIIYFPYGSASIDAQDREILRQIVALQRQLGAYIRVVGHASALTGNQLPEDHRLANFNISLKRANAVAATLVSLGADRSRITSEARGDQQPIYHEFMPNGEAGNRRAEIYLEY